MTASSQIHPGAQPSNPPYAAAAAAAQAAPVPPSVVQLATGVIRAAMSNGSSSAQEIAQAEEDAGILFDPERAQAIASAAYEQAKTEDRAELVQAEQDRQAMDWFHDRWRAVGQLCEGRHPDHMLEVGEVLAAVDGRTPTTAPLTITWDGLVMGPSGDTPNENTLVPCTTARGGRAVLVLDDERRLALGGLLLAVLHTAEGCTTPGCGMAAEDLDASDPGVSGWVLVDVAGTDTGARWWCNPLCAQAAMAAAGAELAAADQLAAIDPDEHVPFFVAEDIPAVQESDEAPGGGL
ncbi:MAG: hypothetical protein HOV92_36950 [Streptomyces sp.]|nr:hypothetical protein [Streptomyces sp.]